LASGDAQINVETLLSLHFFWEIVAAAAVFVAVVSAAAVDNEREEETFDAVVVGSADAMENEANMATLNVQG